MYIQQLVIRNFRVFGNDGVIFLLDKGINVVIGENNNGKSALIDAIRIAFSSALYKKDIYFNRSDFHVDASGCKATTAQIDVYLGDVPKNLIEIWNPMKPDCGEFHVVFSLEKTPSGYEKIKCKTWGGQCEGNPLSQDTLEAINLAYLGALRDAENEMKPARNSKLASLLETISPGWLFAACLQVYLSLLGQSLLFLKETQVCCYALASFRSLHPLMHLNTQD